MIQQCANADCGKPLYYLREGRIFVFNLPAPGESAENGRPARRVQHFWLCGECSGTMVLVEKEDQISVERKSGRVGFVNAVAS